MKNLIREINNYIKKIQHDNLYNKNIIILLKNKFFINSFLKVFISSKYIYNIFKKDISIICDLFISNDIYNKVNKEYYINRIKNNVKKVNHFYDLQIALQKIKTRELIRILWRDITKISSMQDSTKEFSNFADVCIDIALEKIFFWNKKKYGTPSKWNGMHQQLVLLSLGKLGGQELNFSSDVDLIFLYPSSQGETEKNNKNQIIISNETFFIKISQLLIKLLSEIRNGDFIFRVDMRLRPFGINGSIAISFSSFEKYYKKYGKNWERYAFIKARIINSNIIFNNKIYSIINKFVYKKYLDYSAILALRNMHFLINKKISKNNLNFNIKIGYGGIREIEFIAQTYQLIYGGDNTNLQNTNLLYIIKNLYTNGFFSEKKFLILKKSYIYLRNIEHKLQSFENRQTHEIPTNIKKLERILYSLNYKKISDFHKELVKFRNYVKYYFKKLMIESSIQEILKKNTSQNYNSILLIEKIFSSKDRIKKYLKNQGFLEINNNAEIIFDIINLKKYPIKKQLKYLIYYAISIIIKLNEMDLVLKNFIKILTNLLEYNFYILFLIENKDLLEKMINLISISDLIVDFLSKYPVLLSQLEDLNYYHDLLNEKKISNVLNKWISNNKKKDTLEEKIQLIRKYKLFNTFKIIAIDIIYNIPPLQLDYYLTNLAVYIIKYIKKISWDYVVSLYGYPNKKKKCKMMIIAYGKLGSQEIGYNSDLDLVFIIDKSEDYKNTDGYNNINIDIFYLIFIRKIIHIFNKRSKYEYLYKVDLRLRPFGEDGLLFSSLEQFENYLSKKAWIWEYQALIKARAIDGTKFLIKKFIKLRSNILSKAYMKSNLKYEILNMRNKMRNISKNINQNIGKYDIKKDLGGIYDIEFIVQFLVLKYAKKYPIILKKFKNIEIINLLRKEKIIKKNIANYLKITYSIYRSIIHNKDLQKKKYLINETQLLFYRKKIISIWNELFNKRINNI